MPRSSPYRIELDERERDVLESLAQRWATLSDAARDAAAEIARVAKERENRERLTPERKKSPAG